MKTLARVLVVGVGLSVVGCFGYYPRADGTGLVGRDLVLSLSDSGSVVLARQIGAQIGEVTGRIITDSANTYMVSMVSVRSRMGIETDWKGEHIAIPRPLVSQIAERRFSRTRTAVFGTAIGIALYAIREAFQGSGGGFGGPSPSGPTGPK
jgi:hypothetical protein